MKLKITVLVGSSIKYGVIKSYKSLAFSNKSMNYVLKYLTVMLVIWCHGASVVTRSQAQSLVTLVTSVAT